MSKFIQIEPNKITEYKDPFRLFAEDAVTFVKKGETTNPMTIGWGGLGILWGVPCCNVYIHKTRYSKKLFDEDDKFAVCFFGKEHSKQVAYFGTASGKDEDKMAKSGLTMRMEDGYQYAEEAELVILCQKIGQTDFDIDLVKPERIHSWYAKDGVHSIYFGRIEKVLIKEDFLLD